MNKTLILTVASLMLGGCTPDFVVKNPDAKKIHTACGDFDYTVNFQGSASVSLDDDAKKALEIASKWANLLPTSMGIDLASGTAAVFERQAIENTWHRFNCYYQRIDPNAAFIEQEFKNELNAYLMNIDEITVSTTIPSKDKKGELHKRAMSHQLSILGSPISADRKRIQEIDADKIDSIVPKPDFTNEWLIKGVAKSPILGEACAAARQIVANRLSGAAAFAMSNMRQYLIEFATSSMEPRTLYSNLIMQVYFSGEQSFDPDNVSSISAEDFSCLKKASDKSVQVQ